MSFPEARPDPKFDNETKRRCPRDAQLMEKMRIGGVIADRCAGCGCIWLDGGELDKLRRQNTDVKELDAGPVGGPAKGRSLGEVVCPLDTTTLVPMHDSQHDVGLDICPKCGGVLLDTGELADLQELTILERFKSLLNRR